MCSLLCKHGSSFLKNPQLGIKGQVVLTSHRWSENVRWAKATGQELRGRGAWFVRLNLCTMIEIWGILNHYRAWHWWSNHCRGGKGVPEVTVHQRSLNSTGHCVHWSLNQGCTRSSANTGFSLIEASYVFCSSRAGDATQFGTITSTQSAPIPEASYMSSRVAFGQTRFLCQGAAVPKTWVPHSAVLFSPNYF